MIKWEIHSESLRSTKFLNNGIGLCQYYSNTKITAFYFCENFDANDVDRVINHIVNIFNKKVSIFNIDEAQSEMNKLLNKIFKLKSFI